MNLFLLLLAIGLLVVAGRDLYIFFRSSNHFIFDYIFGILDPVLIALAIILLISVVPHLRIPL